MLEYYSLCNSVYMYLIKKLDRSQKKPHNGILFDMKEKYGVIFTCTIYNWIWKIMHVLAGILSINNSLSLHPTCVTWL